jgi:uncharacterized membrane protein
MIRRDALREYSRGSLWFVPAVAAAVALLLGAALSRITVGPTSPLAFQGTADDARALLITIAGTMVTVIALLLGLAVVALQLASTQFSPRLLRNFLRDRRIQLVLGAFVGTFAYSAAGLYQVGIVQGRRVDEFPRFAVTVAMVLMFLSLALLVFFADHLAHSLQVDYIMRVVEQTTLRVIHDLPPGGHELGPLPAGAVAVNARSSGYLQAVHGQELLAAARRSQLNVRLRPRAGHHVLAGTTLAWIWPAAIRPALVHEFEPSLHRAVRLGYERTLEQDPGLGIRQLTDAACKALSPAVNDPYTAVQAIHHLCVLYSALGQRRVGSQVLGDRSDGVVVEIPGWTAIEHLTWGLGLIRRYGASEPTVVVALLRLLTAVALTMSAQPDDLRVIEEQAELLVAGARRSVEEPLDLALFAHEQEELRQTLADLRRGHARAETDA